MFYNGRDDALRNAGQESLSEALPHLRLGRGGRTTRNSLCRYLDTSGTERRNKEDPRLGSRRNRGCRSCGWKSAWVQTRSLEAQRGYRVEVFDGKIIQSRPGSSVVEIPVDRIVSLHESRGRWLIIRGGEPERQMAVPLEIVGFESLKRKFLKIGQSHR